MHQDTQKLLFRWLLGIALFGLALWLAKKGFYAVDPTWMALGALCFVAGLVAVWESLFAAAVRPFTLIIDAVFFPGGPLSKPILNLKLPAYYTKEGRYDEALAEYKKILKHYPDETEAYDRAIWLYVEIFEEPDAAQKLFDKARRRNLVLDDESRSLLKQGDR